MTLGFFARMGIDTLIDMALARKLSPRMLWLAMKGAEKYRSAVAAGDTAATEVQDYRASSCAGCTTCQWVDSKMKGVQTGWCGEPVKETEASCVCLVSLSEHGELQPAGKVVVASEFCPRKQPVWGGVR